MKKILQFVVIVLIALVLGVGSALWVINAAPGFGPVCNGAWTTSPLIGSAEAGMYLRAVIARIALFTLNRTETIYYTAVTDDHGEPLRAECDYLIEGRDIDARWWSITVYGEDHFLVPNAANRYSYNVKNIARDEKGGYKVHLSGTPKQGNWLPSGEKGRLSLTLRAYNPAPSLVENMATARLPRIRRVGCR
jgi:hypothetical protein